MRLLLLLVTSAAVATAQETPQAFIGARILPIAGDQIDSGTLVVHRGKILAVGEDVEVPAGAERHDATIRKQEL